MSFRSEQRFQSSAKSGDSSNSDLFGEADEQNQLESELLTEEDDEKYEKTYFLDNFDQKLRDIEVDGGYDIKNQDL